MLAPGMLCVLALGGTAAAAGGQAEVQALHARIAREAVRGRFLVEAETSLEQLLVATERAIGERRAEAVALEQEQVRLERRRAAIEVRLDAVRSELEALRSRAGRRAAAMLRLARLGTEALWLGIEDPVRARRTEDRLRFVLAHDAALAAEIRAQLQAEAEQERRLAAEIEALRVARARALEEASELDRLEATRRVLLEQLSAERRRSERIAGLLERARAEGARAAAFVGGQAEPPAPRPGGFGAQRGLLRWPTAGRVEATFGAKVHPAGIVVRQSGLDIRAPRGRPVVAVFGGRVAYAERRRGWGRLVVLEHSGGFFTVYAHLDRFDVASGDAVEAGQPLGEVGESGSDKGPHLYFEIRAGDRAIDPLPWLFREV